MIKGKLGDDLNYECDLSDLDTCKVLFGLEGISVCESLQRGVSTPRQNCYVTGIEMGVDTIHVAPDKP